MQISSLPAQVSAYVTTVTEAGPKAMSFPSASAPDRYVPSMPLPEPPPGPRQGFLDRIKPLELVGAVALHVGVPALIAGGLGAGIAAAAGGALMTGALIGAGVGGVLGAAFLAAVLAIAG